ncbi:2-oxoglutarate dehydrogenase complex dihydrolipoyllysine-residue succinyltransferase [Ardenticatena maritima]|uniref:Dihydrolipoyllysine-residue succinyltransferase component of 2-oxoglutarate dehydrogenase complex n=3 Tax=Ardenticatena maritima TaxID=872965 RepID=A0A0P6XXK3_9CHLR|nr:2-oxoglutarate dehydrogenase complex dihydrolipoyllysine-residue succinyltransferase [Ardenticatena maritima]KPL89133.1 dihydrolipoamide succinyltransferase [Ardenticatena maritima]
MKLEIRAPQLGESVVEATVGRWLKKEGEPVKAGEVLAELETDKINVEVAAEQDGVLVSIVRHEGDDVAPGDILAYLETDATAAATAAPEPAPREAAAPPPASQPASSPAEDIKATPVARRLAEETGVDLRQVQGSGPSGRITKEDVLAASQQRTAPTPEPKPTPPPAPAPAPVAPPLVQPGRREERIRMSRRRQTIARRLLEAKQNTAMLTTFNDVDMSAVIELRNRYKEHFQEKYGVRLGFMSFFTKAVVSALKAFPLLNAEIQGDEIVVKYYYDIGIAVGAEGGLVVPVLRDADRLTFYEIEAKIREFAKKANEGTLTLEELQGGTFTITNGGVFGSLLSTPILNPPQVGILGMHRIEERPVVRNGEIVIRPMMYLALSYDHRIVDGREAVQFLVHVKEMIENPERLLLEG